MGMESKRFGGGLLGGLLLGVVVVLVGTVAAGPTIGLYGSFSPAAASVGQAKGTSDVATYTLTYTTTTRGLYQTGNGSATAPGRTNTTTIVTTVTTTFPVYYASNLLSSADAQASPSRLNNIAAQPLATSRLVVVPVLIAIVAGAIGALLYRASISSKEHVPSEQIP